jgi:hypothetical protein
MPGWSHVSWMSFLLHIRHGTGQSKRTMDRSELSLVNATQAIESRRRIAEAAATLQSVAVMVQCEDPRGRSR